MKYLIETTEVYRVDSEQEVQQLIEEAKQGSKYELIKYDRIYKEKKQKGEILETWYRVSLKKKFTDEKEPESVVNVSYGEED